MKKIRYFVYMALLFPLMFSQFTNAAVVDSDSDGLIEINNLDDLDEIRHDVYGTSLRGNSEGCPVDTGCLGFELTRDLDFDSNGNGSIDAGDWNAGQPWVPISGDAVQDDEKFSAIFDGNGHVIRNLRINAITNYYGYGFFGNTYGAEIRNFGLVDSVLNVLIVSDTYLKIGTLIGHGLATNVSNCYVNNGVINTANHSVGGLVGQIGKRANDSTPTGINGSYFNGSINAPGSSVGGIVENVTRADITKSYATGSIDAGFAGGLVGSVRVSGNLTNNFSNMRINVSLNAGGLVFSIDGANAAIHNSYALGSISAINFAGGLVGYALNSNIEIKNSYANNLIQIGNNQYANLIKMIDGNGGGSFSISNSYWVKNPRGVVLSDGSSALGNGGQLLADLQCANNSYDTRCAVPGLLQEWDATVWDFGDTSQLPALKLVSNFPWISTDSPGGNGDYESITRLAERHPEYTCASPTNFHAKEKNSGYIFKATTPDVLRYFNSTQGLACVHADQTSGSCGNYEVSYLCRSGGINSWTTWRSSDTNNGNGDYETHASGCATTPLAIKARLVGKTSVYFSPQQKLNQFNLQKGLTCLNADNNCRDYQIRMACDILGDR